MNTLQINALKNILAFPLQSKGEFNLELFQYVERISNNIDILLYKSIRVLVPTALQVAIIEVAKLLQIQPNDGNLVKILYVVIARHSGIISDCSCILANIKNELYQLEIIQIYPLQSKLESINKICEVINTKLIDKTPPKLFHISHDSYVKYSLHQQSSALYDADNFRFWSKSTHAIASQLALTSKGERYNRQFTASNVVNSFDRLLQHIAVSHSICNITIKEGVEYQDIKQFIQYISAVVDNLLPQNEDSSALIRDRFAQAQPIKFTVNFIDTGYKDYQIKPILQEDMLNNHYYIMWEIANTRLLLVNNPRYTFNFIGNGDTFDQFLSIAYNLLEITDSIQVIGEYPNKGINKLLNPRLKASKISIDGSINPYLMMYNYYKKQHNYAPIELIIHAYSYGNFAATQFIQTIKTLDPVQYMYYTGVATARSLHAVVNSFAGEWLTTLGVNLNLSSHIEVEKTLILYNIPALLFQCKLDQIIKVTAQINQQTNNIIICCIDEILQQNNNGSYIATNQHINILDGHKLWVRYDNKLENAYDFFLHNYRVSCLKVI